MKKILTIFVVAIMLLLCTSCGYVKTETVKADNISMFVEVESAGYWKVVYHKGTKVMYAVSDGMKNMGTFTLLVNPDGTPMLWDGK